MYSVANRLIIAPLKEETVSQAGLHIVSTTKTMVRGIVMFAGEACKTVKVGDTVVYHRDTGMAFEQIRVISELDVVVGYTGDGNG